ncbi:PilZ domain-containing protein [Ectothiorhodospira magna]|uniref:PilZ domain-containing protein n=1 Tax=Ectothiorhodospira magna TaxID=867345 RepID=A0A1H9AUG7_9GAMM|nr:PilZ domain-containing protein [Ectothiorhodospira magna]SEP80053.1 PilZ domain-containing protein [Ectothiorhodospira magna]
MNLNFDEKRDFQRLQLDHPMKITVLDTGQTLQGLGRDLSATGVSFRLSVSVPVGTTVMVTIDASQQPGVLPFQVQAEVIRVTPEDQGYLVAAQISSMA